MLPCPLRGAHHDPRGTCRGSLPPPVAPLWCHPLPVATPTAQGPPAPPLWPGDTQVRADVTGCPPCPGLCWGPEPGPPRSSVGRAVPAHPRAQPVKGEIGVSCPPGRRGDLQPGLAWLPTEGWGAQNVLREGAAQSGRERVGPSTSQGCPVLRCPVPRCPGQNGASAPFPCGPRPDTNEASA